ncbi:hypothetical protein DEIPH_ctg017orf0074 [Deinococcus phoenicis]|uniref:Uncharacterized protein n=1 Tax=Deinococcus phoenicis TaxID=1476583 RepID=A0A016QS65_9DEIO|nr:hypothetical protein [Deinococcus phoenicis]EYB68737.1 hypothetical protein DEIPH_ctg017orf0074 [Deinococcus phoenicis]
MWPALYLLFTLAFAGALLALLWRPGAARAMVIWGLAALLPLLAAVAGALTGQVRATRTLAAYAPQPVTVTIVNGAGRQTLTLSPRDAACVERAVRLHSRSELLTARNPVPLSQDTHIVGALPPQSVVEALGIRGTLTCPNLRALPDDPDSATRE